MQRDEAGLITIWQAAGTISLQRTVFERRAPLSIERVESVIAPLKIGGGNTVRDITQELLDALTAAYREASTETVSSRQVADSLRSPRREPAVVREEVGTVDASDRA